MSTYRVDTTLTKDGTLTLTDLPYQAGDAVEIIIVPRASPGKQGERDHTLRGKVIHYDSPTGPVAQEDWEVLQ